MADLILTLPDASTRTLPVGSTPAQLAAQIGAGLAKAALAAKIDGQLCDLHAPLTADAKVEIVTSRSPEALELLRHSTAHLMAAAVQALFPGTKVTIGPAIESGFYYDFDLPRPVTEDDFPAIEAKMAELMAKGDLFQRSEMTSAEALARFEAMGEPYKCEIIRDLAQPGVSCYQVGGFLDLCRGPHLPGSDRVPAFKLLSVAGAYWRGDERNKMLTRIYGTAFFSKADLEAQLKQAEEAKLRDHRRLGKDLDLFSFHDEGGPGLVYWHPKGALVRKLIEDFWRQRHLESGYDFVVSPHIGKSDLWKTSGHLDFYKEGMYSPMDIDGQDYYVKPMNCPFHILIYKTSIRSYRELPIRYSELGTVYRYERSGTLQGLMRVRGFTQDDSHIFMREDQLTAEIGTVVVFVKEMLQAFGFKEFEVFVATKPKDSIGEPGLWDKATQSLKDALAGSGWEYGIDEGGGAFYGPKIDIRVKDSIGRFWQLSTIQVDFQLPERFDIHYIADDGSRKRPVMIHRALLGSLERFFGILVEHYNGAFPAWLAPMQARVLTITGDQDAFAETLIKRLRQAGLRAEADLRHDKINAKVRDAQMLKIPYSLVVGKKEAEAGQVSLRRHGAPESKVMGIEDFIALAQAEVAQKA